MGGYGRKGGGTLHVSSTLLAKHSTGSNTTNGKKEFVHFIHCLVTFTHFILTLILESVSCTPVTFR